MNLPISIVKKYLWMPLILVALIGNVVFAEDVPGEVMQLVNDIQSGKDDFFKDFDSWKVSMGFDSTTKISDIKAGFPLKKYCINQSWVANSSESIPVSNAIVSPIGQYDIPLIVNGKIINVCQIVKNQNFNGEWHVSGIGTSPVFANALEKIIKKWPASKGYHPVLVENGRDVFLHVPEKDDNNLTYIPVKHYLNDSLEITTDSTYTNLSQSKKTFHYLKGSHGRVQLKGEN